MDKSGFDVLAFCSVLFSETIPLNIFKDIVINMSVFVICTDNEQIRYSYEKIIQGVVKSRLVLQNYQFPLIWNHHIK